MNEKLKQVAPEWVQRAYEQAKGATECTSVTPAQIRARLIRNRIAQAIKGSSRLDLEQAGLDRLTEIAAEYGVDVSDILSA